MIAPKVYRTVTKRLRKKGLKPMHLLNALLGYFCKYQTFSMIPTKKDLQYQAQSGNPVTNMATGALVNEDLL